MIASTSTHHHIHSSMHSSMRSSSSNGHNVCSASFVNKNYGRSLSLLRPAFSLSLSISWSLFILIAFSLLRILFLSTDKFLSISPFFLFSLTLLLSLFLFVLAFSIYLSFFFPSLFHFLSLSLSLSLYSCLSRKSAPCPSTLVLLGLDTAYNHAINKCARWAAIRTDVHVAQSSTISLDTCIYSHTNQNYSSAYTYAYRWRDWKPRAVAIAGPRISCAGARGVSNLSFSSPAIPARSLHHIQAAHVNQPCHTLHEWLISHSRMTHKEHCLTCDSLPLIFLPPPPHSLPPHARFLLPVSFTHMHISTHFFSRWLLPFFFCSLLLSLAFPFALSLSCSLSFFLVVSEFVIHSCIEFVTGLLATHSSRDRDSLLSLFDTVPTLPRATSIRTACHALRSYDTLGCLVLESPATWYAWRHSFICMP